MYFYILQLFDIDYRDDIVLAMTSSGMEHATVVEGTNLDQIIQRDFPLFTTLFAGKEDRERYSQLFFGLIESREPAEAFVEVLRQAGIENDREEIFRFILLQGERMR